MTNIDKRRRSRKLALGLFVTTALSSMGAATPVLAHDPQQQSYDVFFSSKYNYCDATMISKLWGISVGDAKAQIGEKILNGIGDNIPYVLGLSREAGNQCDWTDIPYSYEDAVLISQIWDLGGASEAKSKMAMLATAGNQHWIDAALSR